MPGKGSQKRTHLIAKQAYQMRSEGYTNREIAAWAGKPVENVPKLIELGQRLLQTDCDNAACPCKR